MGAQKTGSLAVSEWVIAEFSAALSIKQRMGSLDSVSRAATLQKFKEFITTDADVLVVGSGQFRSAAAFADQSILGLRAGDALHLAIALEHACVLHTLDERLASAGLALGISTVLL